MLVNKMHDQYLFEDAIPGLRESIPTLLDEPQQRNSMQDKLFSLQLPSGSPAEQGGFHLAGFHGSFSKPFNHRQM